MTYESEPPKIDACQCGAPLTWQSRESAAGKRWLALCPEESCGAITTSPHERDGGLHSFLLGDTPIRRELKPWNRFFFRTSALGYRWTPAPEPCPECSDELTSALEIEWNPRCASEPFMAMICSRCGYCTVSSWIERERIDTLLPGEAWFQPAPQIALLTRVLLERARLAAGYCDWEAGD